MTASNCIDSLRFRLFWLKYGVAFVRSSQLSVRKVKIAGRTVKLSVPAGEEKAMNYEFQNIFYDDCYGLAKIDGPVESVLDVGGNLGFFSLAARSRFPRARIHSYEPNPQVHPHLLNNTALFSIAIHPEAIGAQAGWIDMESSGSSLLARTVASESGKIKMTAIDTALDRIGGAVDLLKLDCEGGEWQLFEHVSAWKKIRRLTMEYHLWAKPELEVPEMLKMIRNIGFRITHLNEAPELKWGVLHATRL